MSNKKKKYIIFSVFILLVIPALCLLYSYYEARNVILKEMTFSNKDLPDSFVGKKIIFISDIHVNEYFTGEAVADLVTRINERQPDIVILGGDYTRKQEEYSQAFFREISKLESKFGVYTVLGNHDHWESADLIQGGFIDCGFHICDNQSYWIRNGNDSIKIGGVGDYWIDEQLLENTIHDVKETDFCLLISHNPDYLEEFDSDLVDLMLSGHTHAAQVTFFGVWAPIVPSTGHPEFPQTGLKYRYGWKEKGNIRLYVTSGVGMGGFPLRFFARPEIVEITLSK